MKNNELKTVAKAFFQEKEFEKAIDVCLNIIEENPEDHEAYTIMGDCYFEKGMKDCAEELFKKAWEKNKDNFQSGYRYGLSLINQKKFDEALESFIKLEHIVESSEEFALLMSEISQLYFIKKDYKKSEESIRKAMEYSDNNVKYLQGLARLLYSTEKFEKAEEIYDEVIKAKDNITVDYITLMKIYIALKKYKKAIKVVENVDNCINFEYFSVLKAYIYIMNDNEEKFIDTMASLYTELEEYNDLYIALENAMFTLFKYEEFEKISVLAYKYKGKFEEEYNLRLELIELASDIMLDKNDFIKNTSNVNNSISGVVQYILQAGLNDIAYQITLKLMKIADSSKVDKSIIDKSMLYYFQYVILRDKEDFENALKKLKDTIKLDDREEYFIELVTLLNDMDNITKGLDIIHERIKKTKNQEFIDIYNEMLGDFYFDEGDFESAKDKYKKLYKIDGDEFIIIKLAECYFNLNDLDNSQKILNDNKKLDKTQEYMLLKARILNRNEKIDEAVKVYGKLIKNYPEYYIPYIDMANLMVDKGEIKGAKNVLEDALEIPFTSDEEKEFIKHYLSQLE
ncbi:MAG: tetratricopeptide repeat protein [Candidatus Muirbacterium halophilum]|nr:tetratricopeptide repeat protein [Candidatus Muirbacterium halophilum]MCK9476079.1 tetratricopeptide repeat protein [Candidatus Muirbacterium halophilum]